MRIAAIIFIIAAVLLNFFVDHSLVLLLAMLSYPVLLWVLFKRKRSAKQPVPTPPTKHKPRDNRFDDLQEIPMDKA